MSTTILGQVPLWQVGPAPRRVWLTTGDAARVLRITADGVRWLVHQGRLEYERTLSGQFLFREDDVRQLAHRRVDAVLVTVRPMRRPRTKGLDARQQPLFGVQLRMVKALSPRRNHLGIAKRKGARS